MAFEGLAKGLLSAGEAFNEGYDKASQRELEKQKMAQEAALRNRAYKMELAQRNLVETPQGGYDLSDEAKQEKQLDKTIKTAGLLNQGIELDETTGDVKMSDWKKGMTDAEIGLKKAQTNKLWSEINKEKNKTVKIPTEADKFKSLPENVQTGIMDLEKTNIKKVNAHGKFQSILNILDDASISNDQKLQQAENTLKMLNDPENSDALAQEEAARASDYLQFYVIPRIRAGTLRWGTDMKGFKEQIKLSIKKTEDSFKSNQQVIEKLKRGESIDLSTLNQPKKQSVMSEGDNKSGLIKNQIMVQDKDGKKYLIEPGDLDAALADGAVRVK